MHNSQYFNPGDMVVLDRPLIDTAIPDGHVFTVVKVNDDRNTATLCGRMADAKERCQGEPEMYDSSYVYTQATNLRMFVPPVPGTTLKVLNHSAYAIIDGVTFNEFLNVWLTAPVNGTEGKTVMHSSALKTWEDSPYPSTTGKRPALPDDYGFSETQDIVADHDVSYVGTYVEPLADWEVPMVKAEMEKRRKNSIRRHERVIWQNILMMLAELPELAGASFSRLMCETTFITPCESYDDAIGAGIHITTDLYLPVMMYTNLSLEFRSKHMHRHIDQAMNAYYGSVTQSLRAIRTEQV